MNDAVIARPADRDPRILIITINRPQARNAINGDVARGLASAMDTLEGDPSLRAAVLTGAGPGFIGLPEGVGRQPCLSGQSGPVRKFGLGATSHPCGGGLVDCHHLLALPLGA